MRRPFFRTQTKSWYVWLDGNLVPLGKDKEAAFRKYREMTAGEGPCDPNAPAAQLLLRFLRWLGAKTEEAKSYHAQFCHSLADHLGDQLKIRQLEAWHVSQWLAAQESAVERKAALRCAARVLNWASREGLIDSKPAADLELMWAASAGRGEAAEDAFADLLLLAGWHESQWLTQRMVLDLLRQYGPAGGDQPAIASQLVVAHSLINATLRSGHDS